MKDPKLLDDGFDDEHNYADQLDIVKWWEKRRLIYNVLLLILELALIRMYYWESTNTLGMGNAILVIIKANLAANLVYLSFWVSELLFWNLIKKIEFHNDVRYVLYAVGLWLSLAWILDVYHAALP